MQSRHEEVLEQLRARLGAKLVSAEVRQAVAGVKRSANQITLWITVGRDDLRSAVTVLRGFGPLHVSTPMASKEYQQHLELIYPLALFGGSGDWQELPVIIAVSIPKPDLRIKTLTDLVPGILFMERETIEMLGVEIEGIPDKSRLWTPDNLSPDLKPMRGIMHSLEGEAGGGKNEPK